MNWFNGKLVVIATNKKGEEFRSTLHDINSNQATQHLIFLKDHENTIIEAIYYPSPCNWSN